MYELCQKKPIADLVGMLLPWETDGRNFWEVGEKKRKACFIPLGQNFIVHGGTEHFPGAHVGYSPFEFVKVVKNLSNRDTFLWFRNTFPDIEKASAEARELTQSGKAFDYDAEHISWSDVSQLALSKKKTFDAKKICTYGIPELDALIHGIFPGELVILAADTGHGKSEIGTRIVQENALRGKKVLYYQLEMGIVEPIDRIVLWKYNAFAKEHNLEFLSQKDFLVSKYSPGQWNVLESLYIEQRECGKNITMYREGSLSFETFLHSLAVAPSKGIDLVVLDHLHYFSMDEYKESMTQSLADVMRKVRMIVREKDIPVVALAHTRKPPDTKQERILSIYDIFGTGNISKEATTVLLAKRTAMDKTEIILAKSRGTGQRDAMITVDLFPVSDDPFQSSYGQ